MDFSFCPTLAEMLATRKAHGESGKVFEGLDALSTINNLTVLRNFVLRHRPSETLEVGLAYGGSCLAIAATHKEMGAGRHIAIDPFQPGTHQWGWDNAGFVAIRKAGLSDIVEVRQELSSLAMPQLVREGRRFGLIYVDGGHFFDDVFVDLYYALKLLTPDGVVMVDDAATDHIRKAIAYFLANMPVAEVDLSPYRHTDLRYRLAKRLGRIQLRALRSTGKDSRAWGVPLKAF